MLQGLYLRVRTTTDIGSIDTQICTCEPCYVLSDKMGVLNPLYSVGLQKPPEYKSKVML